MKALAAILLALAAVLLVPAAAASAAKPVTPPTVLSAEVYSACGYEPPYYTVEIEFQYKNHQPQTTSEVFFDFADVTTFLAEFGLTPAQVGATVCP